MQRDGDFGYDPEARFRSVNAETRASRSAWPSRTFSVTPCRTADEESGDDVVPPVVPLTNNPALAGHPRIAAQHRSSLHGDDPRGNTTTIEDREDVPPCLRGSLMPLRSRPKLT